MEGSWTLSNNNNNNNEKKKREKEGRRGKMPKVMEKASLEAPGKWVEKSQFLRHSVGKDLAPTALVNQTREFP